MEKNTKPENTIIHSPKSGQSIYPTIIGLGVIAFIFYREFDPGAFDTSTTVELFMAYCCPSANGFARYRHIIKFRILSETALASSGIQDIMLWEFTSAITPSAIGGTSVAILYVHKEGISIGRSSAIVMATSLLDELYHHHVSPVTFVC